MTAVRDIVAALGVIGLLWTGAAFAASPKSADEAVPVVRFIPLAPLSAAIINNSRVSGRVTIDITIEILKPEEASEVQRKVPRLQSAWLNVYQRHIGRLSGLTECLDLEVMIGDMRRASDIVVGNDVVRPLIQNIAYSR